MSAVPAGESGTASGLIAATRVVGQVLSVAIAGAVFIGLGGAAAGAAMVADGTAASPAQPVLDDTFLAAMHAALLVSGSLAAVGAAISLAARVRRRPRPPAFIVYGAGGIELVTGALIAVGFFTAPAAFLASGTMAAAFFMGHVMSPQNPTHNILPIVNKGELAVVYCWLFLFVAAKGAGIWSVDASRGAKT